MCPRQKKKERNAGLPGNVRKAGSSLVRDGRKSKKNIGNYANNTRKKNSGQAFRACLCASLSTTHELPVRTRKVIMWTFRHYCEVPVLCCSVILSEKLRILIIVVTKGSQFSPVTRPPAPIVDQRWSPTCIHLYVVTGAGVPLLLFTCTWSTRPTPTCT